jgi:hypothetical protein
MLATILEYTVNIEGFAKTYMENGWPCLGFDIIGLHRMAADATSVIASQQSPLSSTCMASFPLFLIVHKVPALCARLVPGSQRRKFLVGPGIPGASERKGRAVDNGHRFVQRISVGRTNLYYSAQKIGASVYRRLVDKGVVACAS